MELTHQDVHEILRILEHSDVGYLEVEVGGTRVVADRGGGGLSVREGSGPLSTAATADGDSAVSHGDSTAPEATVDVAGSAAPEDTDLVTVAAPVVGVFYRSPEPGAAPFTDEGAQVEEGATLGLVEVMKMFNSVTAPVAGHVVRVLVENAAFVEFGQPLITIRPDDT